MKKVFIGILFVCIAVSAFAATFNINTGVGFGFNSGKIPEDDVDTRNYGFDVQLGFNAEFDNHLVLYDNVDFVISPKIQEKSSETGDKWKDSDKVRGVDFDSVFGISEDAGAGYAFHFGSFRLIAGGGVHLDYLLYKFKGDDGTSSNVHIGVNTVLQGDYFFNRHFGVVAALKPSITFYDSLLNKRFGSDTSADGTVWGFNGAAIIGATYRF